MSRTLEDRAADFIRQINTSKHERQLTIALDLFKQGQELEDKQRASMEEMQILKQNSIGDAAVIRQLKQEISDYRESYNTLQKVLGVTEHKLTEFERQVLELENKSSAPKISVINVEPDLPRIQKKNVDPTIYSEMTSQISDRKSELYKINDKFTGQDKSLYPSFQRHIRIALAQNADRYVTLQSQISLIYQNLGPEPQSFLDQYLSATGIFHLPNLNSVWEILDVSYRNPNEEEEARTILNALRQKNRSFGAFLAEFQKYRNISGITDEGTLISYLRAGVSSEMRGQISQQQNITKRYTFPEFVELCKECQLRIELSRPSHPSRISSAQNRSTGHDQIANSVTNPANLGAINGPATGANLVPLGDPMILDIAKLSHLGPDGKLTTVERNRRFELNLCMRCGKAGHRAANCKPNSPRLQELSLEDGTEEAGKA